MVLRGFVSENTARARSSQKLEKSPQLVSKQARKKENRHSFHPRKIEKKIQKGKLTVNKKMEDRKYNYKKMSLSKITLGPHRSKSSFGNIF